MALTLPYSKASTAEEYFSLSKREREKYGLYLTPFALPWGGDENDNGWNAFDKRIRAEYPVQFFFRKTVASFLRRIKYRYFETPYYNIRTWLDNPNKRIRACVPRHKWIDRCGLVWDLGEAIILDFKIESDKSCVDWSSDELKEVKQWVDFAHDKIIKTIPSLELKKDSIYASETENKYEQIELIEKEIRQLKENILLKLVKYREYLWT